MPIALAWLLPLALAATVEVPAGGDLAAALSRARPGDVVRLGEGIHRASLGRPKASLRIEGAGPERTQVLVPEGEDGLVVEGGEVTLRGVLLRAGPARCALKVMGGAARVEDAVLAGGACGAFVQVGTLDARRVDLLGRYGLLARSGEARLDVGAARGTDAGVAVLGGRVALSRVAVTGPSREAGVTSSGGETLLEAVVIRAPGPSGIAVAGPATVTGTAVDVSGAREEQGFLGDCVQLRRGTLRLEAATLARCGGAALEAFGGSVDLRGVEAAGGEAGCLALLDGARAELVGNLCTGRGPALVAASGARATARMNRWHADPALWVECASGSAVELGPGETVRQPCQPAR